MGRSPCCEKTGLKKGTWTPEEDRKLLAYINEHGHGSWRALPAKAGLQRCGKSCRLRWANYLRPDIKRGKFASQEEQTIIQLHALLGNRWSTIASHLPKRTDNEIKNYWNTHLKKRLTKMGIDPVTHKPRITTVGYEQAQDIANLSHMTQWENARLEAEARLVRESRLVSNSYHQIHHISSHQFLVPPLQWPQPLCLDVLKAWQSNMWYNGALVSPTSTLNLSENVLAPAPITGSIGSQSWSTTDESLSENALPPAPIVGSIDSQSWSTTDESMFTLENNCPSDWKTLENSLDVPKIVKEEAWTVGEISEIMHDDNYLMEAFTDVLVDNLNNENCGGDFEQTNNYSGGLLYTRRS